MHTFTVGDVELDNSDVSADSLMILLESCSSVKFTQTQYQLLHTSLTVGNLCLVAFNSPHFSIVLYNQLSMGAHTTTRL